MPDFRKSHVAAQICLKMALHESIFTEVQVPAHLKINYAWIHLLIHLKGTYSKTCLKLPLKNRQNKDSNDKG